MTPSPGETITGNERIGWNQAAANAAELTTFRYAIYVDGTRSELTGVTCGTSAVNGRYECSARLPTLAQGTHSLELASFIVDGGVLESARSSPLRVTLGVAPSGGDQTPGAAASRIVDIAAERMALEVVAEGVDRPNDIAFAPDGRLFVAEEFGRIRIVQIPPVGAGVTRAKADASESRTPNPIGDRVLAIALDPEFSRTRFVYALYTVPGRLGVPTFTIARFRVVSGTLAERIKVLDEIRAAEPRPAGSLRFGADGKLFAALDDGGDPAQAEDLASFNGKVLRLNPNGTTPDDQAGASPLYASVYRAPKGFDWDASTGLLWLVDAAGGGAARLNAIVSADNVRKRGVTRATVALPADSAPSSIATYRGRLLPSFEHSLVIASNSGQHLLRVRLDPADATRVIGMDRLLQNRVGGLRAVTIGADGAVYFATDTTIGRLAPASP
jgi:glucose/arabinose dehydrogenase